MVLAETDLSLAKLGALALSHSLGSDTKLSGGLMFRGHSRKDI